MGRRSPSTMTPHLQNRLRLALTVLAVSAAVVTARVATDAPPAAAAPASSQPATLSQADLLGDTAFEDPGLTPWAVSPGQNWALYASSSAPVGQTYLETNAGSSTSPSVYQDTPSAPEAGHSYQASVYLRSPSSKPLGVAMVLWALGGSIEVGKSLFTVASSTWTRYTTDIDLGGSAENTLRFQLYFGAGANLDVGGAMLQDAGVGDAGFGQGLGPWGVSPGQNFAVYGSQSPPVGSNYLETNAGSSSSPSVYEDVDVIPVVGHNYEASLAVRSPTGTPIPVALVLWATGGSSTEDGQTQVTVSSTAWTTYYANLDVSDPGHTALRLQVYFGSSANLDLGAAMLQDSGVGDSDFDQTGLGPWQVSPGANWANGGGSGGLGGTTWLQTNTNGAASSSLYEDVPTNLVAGTSYSGSVFFKSFGSPIPVSVVLWALGGPNPIDVGQTAATIGSSWQSVSAVVDVGHPGHDDLRLQVYLSGSSTLGVDLAALPGVDDDPPLGPPSLVHGVGVYGPSSYPTIASEIAQGWPVVGETGGLGTTQSPYTAALPGSPDLAAAQAIAQSGRSVTWLSFWTVSAPAAGDSWYGDGLAAGNYVASYLDSVSSTVKPAFVILDPEGYPNAQANPYPSDPADWVSWMQGWSTGITSVDSSLTPGLYVDQYEYASGAIAALDMPTFVAIEPILGNVPGNGVSYTPSANVDGYIAIGGGCPASPYESTIASWGASYNTLQFPDSGDDCQP